MRTPRACDSFAQIPEGRSPAQQFIDYDLLLLKQELVRFRFRSDIPAVWVKPYDADDAIEAGDTVANLGERTIQMLELKSEVA